MLPPTDETIASVRCWSVLARRSGENARMTLCGPTTLVERCIKRFSELRDSIATGSRAIAPLTMTVVRVVVLEDSLDRVSYGASSQHKRRLVVEFFFFFHIKYFD